MVVVVETGTGGYTKSSESEIERAFRFLDGPDRDAVGVDHGRFQAGVPKEFLNNADVVSCLQKMGGKRMAEDVGGGFIGNLRLPDSVIKRSLEIGFMEMEAPQFAGLHHLRP